MDILEFVRILKEKARVAVLLLVAGVLVGVVANFVLPSIYECNTTFMVLEAKLIRRNLEGRDLDIDTYLQFVENQYIFRTVYDELEIGKRFDMDFETFQRSFEVNSVEDTAIVDLITSFEDPQACLDVATRVGELALALNKEVVQAEVRSGRASAEQEIVGAREKLAQAKVTMEAFLLEYPVNQMAVRIDALRNRILLEETGGYVNYPMIEVLANAGEYQSPLTTSGITSAFPSRAQLEYDVAEIENRLKHAGTDSSKDQLTGKLAAARDLLKRKEQLIGSLRTQLQEKEQEYFPLKTRYNELLSEFDAASKGYADIYAKGLEANLEVLGKTNEMTIIDPPVFPDHKTFPKLVWMLIGGFFLGVISMFAYAVMVGFFRKLADD